MEVFYINLERRRDRRDRFLATNALIANFHRAEAADGRSLQREDLLKNGVVQEPLPDYSPGALGCATSHKRLWEMCVASSSTVTLAEDDAVFNRQFRLQASALLARLPVDWEIVLWGWNFDSMLHVDLIPGVKDAVMHFQAAKLGERMPEFQDRRYEVMPLRLLGAFGSVSYSISPRGARRLAERCFPLKQEWVSIPGLKRSIPNFGIDVAMNKHYHEIQAFVCFPPLVWTDNDKTTSDIPIPGEPRQQSDQHEVK